MINISNNNFVRIYLGNATKTGDASNLENSKYYGANSSFLVNKAKGQIQNFNISKKVVGSHAVCSVNDVEVILNNSKLETIKDNLSAFFANYGGKIECHYFLITT